MTKASPTLSRAMHQPRTGGVSYALNQDRSRAGHHARRGGLHAARGGFAFAAAGLSMARGP